ncbi:MAG: Trk system potassium transporter TrkA [Ichthyobacteriaceae bacterium]|nr:Trk system potassium transporter TrkA [Ichthyobacteriaceae bacterium]
MRIIISGDGDVVFYLAKNLAEEYHDITVIDEDEEHLDYISNHIDVATIKGSSTSLLVLKELNIDKVDMFCAVSKSQDRNLVTASLAKGMGAKKCIARITDPTFLYRRDIFDLQKLGVDEVISTEALASKEIRRLLRETAITDTFEFAAGKLSLIGIRLNGNETIIGKTLAEAFKLSNLNFLTVAILRGGQTIIPNGSTVFELGDHVYYITQPEGLKRILKQTGKISGRVKTIMILGGGDIGVSTALALNAKYRVILVEKDRKKSHELADILKNTLVINGDGRDVELLEEEGISDVDAFIAVTGNSETNIIASLVAKSHNVPKTIALVENMDFIHLSQNIGIDTLINKKLIAANFISRYVRKGRVTNLASLPGVDIEVAEYVVHSKSEILNDKLMNLGFTSNVIVGGVIRGNKAFTPNGDFIFKVGDRVIVTFRRGAQNISKVDKFFE